MQTSAFRSGSETRRNLTQARIFFFHIYGTWTGPSSQRSVRRFPVLHSQLQTHSAFVDGDEMALLYLVLVASGTGE